MSRFLIRVTLMSVVTLGFFLLWASIAFNWVAPQWIVPISYALLAIGIAVGVIRRSRRLRVSAPELSASDAYSDLQLGRRPSTHYPHEGASISQIGDPPERN